LNIPEKIRRNYKIRNERLFAALQDGVTRTDEPARTGGEKCAICHRAEWGGGLLIYHRRDGSELLAGGTCAEYLDYLVIHPHDAPTLSA
jgi:hypothetical protein